LSEKDLTLQRAIDLTVASEMAILQENSNISPEQQLDLCAIRWTCQCCGKPGHSEAVCCFRTRTCFKCGKRGHLQSVCKSRTQKSEEVNREKHIEEHKAASSDNDFALWTVTGRHRKGYHVVEFQVLQPLSVRPGQSSCRLLALPQEDFPH